MRTRLGGLFLALAVAALISGCSSEPAVRVLFVGNSYTGTNNLPEMVRQLAGSAGHNVDVEMVAPGGWWWRDHAASSTVDKISGGEFDFVVFQEQSMVTADRDMALRMSRPPLVDMALSATMTGAKPVLFMTWGHYKGSMEVDHSSYDSMQRAIADTYTEFGSAAGGEVAPVGMAWWMSLAERPDILLYQPDWSHPSPAGTYLAAAVITGTILDVDPTTFDDDLDVISDHAEALRGFAARAVEGEVPWE